MTLFKKVFQHQGKPVAVDSEETPTRPYAPEPAEMPTDVGYDPDLGQADPDAYNLSAEEQVLEEQQTHEEEHAVGAVQDVDWTADDEAEDAVEADDDWNEPDLAYVLEQARPEPSQTEPLEEAETTPEPATSTAPAEQSSPEPEQTGAVEPEPINTVDVAAFAREQMRAAGLETPAPVHEPAPVPPAAPSLDLSQSLSDAAARDTAPQGMPGRRGGRVKTRLLGFNRGAPDTSDPFDSTQAETAIQGRGKFPVGWLVVVDGPGTGHSFALFSGASMIGRGEDQVIKLDFGDNSISRQNHAAIAYDDEENKFFIGHGGKSNIIRLNARPVLSTEELHHSDLVRIGETTLRFVALCGKDFQWDHAGDTNAASV